jgi:hypothetical protein
VSERSRFLVRVGLVYLAATGLVVGLWAGLAPRAFYDDFPGLGRVWVAVDGPYNEHLVRDVGWWNLALAAATVWAAVSLARGAIVAVLVAWLVTSVPHLGYHVAHLDGLATSDRIGEVASLVLIPAVAAALLAVVASGGRRWADDRGSPSSGGR